MEKRSFFSRITGMPAVNLPKHSQIKTAGERHPPAKKRPVAVEQCALDVYQADDGLVIRAFVAGVRPEDLDINIVNGTLTIRGSRAETEQTVPEDYYYQECYFGPFSRSVILPENTYGETVSAKLKNGVLTVRLPKIKKADNAVSTN